MTKHAEMTMADKRLDVSKKTMSIPEAGAYYFDLSRAGSYDAARRGEIPYIRIGRLKRVPVRAMEAMLDKIEGATKAVAAQEAA
jgi:hypothetical protein